MLPTEQKVFYNYPKGYSSPIAVDEGVLTRGLLTLGITDLPKITFQSANKRYPGTLGLSSTFGDDVYVYTDLIVRSVSQDFLGRETFYETTEDKEHLTPAKILLGALMLPPYLAQLAYNKIFKSPTFKETEGYVQAKETGDIEQALLSYTSYVLGHEIAHGRLPRQRILRACDLILTSGLVLESITSIGLSVSNLFAGTNYEQPRLLMNSVAFSSLGLLWLSRFLQEVHADRFALKASRTIQEAMSINLILD